MKCTYYYIGGKTTGKWKRTDKELKEEIQKMGYVALAGDTNIGPPDTPPTKEELDELLQFQKEKVEPPFTEKRILCSRCEGNSGYVEITWKYPFVGKETLCTKCWAMLHESFSTNQDSVDNRRILEIEGENK